MNAVQREKLVLIAAAVAQLLIKSASISSVPFRAFPPFSPLVNMFELKSNSTPGKNFKRGKDLRHPN